MKLTTVLYLFGVLALFPTGCANYATNNHVPDSGEADSGPDGGDRKATDVDIPSDDDKPRPCDWDLDCPGFKYPPEACCSCVESCVNGECLTECFDDPCCSTEGGCNYDCGPMFCDTHEDCETPWNPALPPDACCGCGAWCDSGRCVTLCVDAMCCFYYGGCGPQCEALCTEHEQCWEEELCVDGQCSSIPPVCGTEPNPGCHQGLDQDACVEHGGMWNCAPAGMCRCICPTGDLGCPCWKPIHCKSPCVAQGDSECNDTIMGECLGYLELAPGCYCLADEDGTFLETCID